MPDTFALELEGSAAHDATQRLSSNEQHLLGKDSNWQAEGRNNAASASSAKGQRQHRSVARAPRPVRMWPAVLAIVALCCVSATTVTPSTAYVLDTARPVRSALSYARAATTALLEVFQIYPPVSTVGPNGELEITDGSSNASVDVIPSRQPTCSETLVVHSFGNSYGQPYVGPYTPPSCSFNRVTWNLTVVSAGRQFDRLGSVSFGDVELFRTSTAEPTQNGIEWTYLKVGRFSKMRLSTETDVSRI